MLVVEPLKLSSSISFKQFVCTLTTMLLVVGADAVMTVPSEVVAPFIMSCLCADLALFVEKRTCRVSTKYQPSSWSSW